MGKSVRSFPMLAGMLSVVAMSYMATTPTRADAQNSCKAFSVISVNPSGPAGIADTRTITLTLGADEIIGGTQVTISQVRYDLDCNGDMALTIPCTDQGDIFNYQGDVTITTSCGTCMVGNLNAGASCAPVGPGGGCDAPGGGPNDGTCVPLVWTSNVPAGGNATNEIVFTPSTPIDIPAFTAYCNLSFDVKVDNLEPNSGPSSDSTPNDTEVVAGFVGNDAVCDNSLTSTYSQSVSIPLTSASTCGNGLVQAGETCDPPSSTPSVPAGNTNLCRSDCTYCGDGILNGPETCDSGGTPNRACHTNCTGRLAKDPGSIAFGVGGTGLDRLQINGRITPPAPIDLANVNQLGISLSDANNVVIFTQQLAASLLQPVGRKFKFRNRGAKSDPAGGFTDFQFSPHKDGYRIKLVVYGNLSGVTSEMTVDIFFIVNAPGGGTAQSDYTSKATWVQTRRGWRETGGDVHP